MTVGQLIQQLQQAAMALCDNTVDIRFISEHQWTDTARISIDEEGRVEINLDEGYT